MNITFFIILIIFQSYGSEALTCRDKILIDHPSLFSWMNKNAFNQKYKERSCVQLQQDIDHIYSMKKIELDPQKLALCVKAKIGSEQVREGLYKVSSYAQRRTDLLKAGCYLPQMIHERRLYEENFRSCRDNLIRKEIKYFPNRFLPCGANYCFLLQVDHMISNDLNNCLECAKLRAFIERAPLLSLGLHDIIAKALKLSEYDLSKALLISYYTLGTNYKRDEKERNRDYFQASLKSVHPNRSIGGDNFGPFYHFFGTAFFAQINRSASLAKLGSIFQEKIGDLYNKRDQDNYELYMDIKGVEFLEEFIKVMNSDSPKLYRSQNYCNQYLKQII